MDQEILLKREELIAHLEKREKFKVNELVTIVCPSPLRLLGENYYPSNLLTCIGQNLLLTFFRNDSGKVKLYDLGSPGVIKLDPGKNFPATKDPLAKNIYKTVLNFKHQKEIYTGFTGALSLPSRGNTEFSNIQTELAVYLALIYSSQCKSDINKCCQTFIGGLNPGREENGYLAASCICREGEIISISTGMDTPDYITFSNKSPEINFITAFIKPCDNFSGNILNNENFRKATTLTGLITGHKNLTDISEISYDVFSKCLSKLPSDIQDAATHYYNELNNIRLLGKLWENGELPEFGNLITESSLSRIRLKNQSGIGRLIENFSDYKGVLGIGFDNIRDTFRIFVIAKKDDTETISQELKTELQKTFQSNIPVNSAGRGEKIYIFSELI